MTMISGPERDSLTGDLRLPVLMMLVALFVLMAFETGQAIHDRGALADLQRSQEPTIQEAIRVRQQLETLASKTAQLASDGDEGAKSVVDQMKRQGVTLSPPKQ
jgi:hypothetical protein